MIQRDPPHRFPATGSELLALDAARGAGPHQVHQGRPGRRRHPVEAAPKADLGTRVGSLQTNTASPPTPDCISPRRESAQMPPKPPVPQPARHSPTMDAITQ